MMAIMPYLRSHQQEAGRTLQGRVCSWQLLIAMQQTDTLATEKVKTGNLQLPSSK